MTKISEQAENKIEITGTIVETTLQEKEKNGNPYINGYIDIEAEDGNVHRVSVFANKYKKDAKDRSKFTKEVSGLYTGLTTVKDTYEVGNKVRINQGQYGANDYVGADSILRTYPQISSNFFNRLKETDEFKPESKFTIRMIVSQVKEEKNRQGEETGRVILEGYVPVFGGKIAPFTGTVEAGKKADYVLENYEKNGTVTVYGKIVNFTETIEKEIEVEFGDPSIETTTKTVREYQITGGGKLSEFDEDDANCDAYDPNELKKALQEREAYLEELKAKKEQSNVSDGFPDEKKKSPFEDKKVDKKTDKKESFKWD